MFKLTSVWAKTPGSRSCGDNNAQLAGDATALRATTQRGLIAGTAPKRVCECGLRVRGWCRQARHSVEELLHTFHRWSRVSPVNQPRARAPYTRAAWARGVYASLHGVHSRAGARAVYFIAAAGSCRSPATQKRAHV